MVASTFAHIRSFHLPYLAAFAARGDTVDVAAGGEALPLPHAAQCISLPFEKRITAPGNFAAQGRLRKLMWSEHYDLVIVHTSLAAYFTRRAALSLRSKRPPVINVVHGYLFDQETPFAKRELLLSAERQCARATDLLLTMNRFDDDLARRYRLSRHIEKIPGMGVPFSALEADPGARTALRDALRIPPNALCALYAAEFSDRKRHTLLLTALRKTPSDLYLLLAGSGAELALCRRYAVELGIGSRVRFLGQRRDMPKIYASADMAVSTSRSEGLPFFIMEAMHCRLPVAASAVKGHSDLIDDGESGLLFTQDSPEACARALTRLCESHALRARLSENAHERASDYDLARVLPQVMAQYTSLL